MSDFHSIGNAVVDFDRVRMIAPAEKGFYGGKGIFVFYADGNEDFIPDDDPPDTMARLLRMCAEMNRAKAKQSSIPKSPA